MQNFAVFDIDKTLYQGTLAVDFVEALSQAGLIDNDLEEAVQYRKLVPDNDHSAHDQALIAMLQAAQNSGTMDYLHYLRIGKDVAARCTHHTHKRPLQLFHEQEGKTRIALSTSPYAVVKPFCDRLGFDIVIAPMPQNMNGILGPRSIIKARERSKGEWLQMLVALYGFNLNASIGIGDSMSDLSFLELVEHPIAFMPDQELLAIAQSKRWEVWHE